MSQMLKCKILCCTLPVQMCLLYIDVDVELTVALHSVFYVQEIS